MAIIGSVAWYRLQMERLLPESLKDIAAAIGYENTILLVNKYGGQRLWIKRQPTLDWDVLLLLGYEATYALCKLCGGSQIEISTCQFLKIEERNQQIRCDRATHSIEALARKYGLRREWIRQIVRAGDTVLA